MTDHDHAADRIADQRIADRIRAAFADEHPSIDLAAVLERAATTTGPGPDPTHRPVRRWLIRLLRRDRPSPGGRPPRRWRPSGTPARRHP